MGTSKLDLPFDSLAPHNSTTNEPGRPPSDEIVDIGLQVDLYCLDDGKPPGVPWAGQSPARRLTRQLHHRPSISSPECTDCSRRPTHRSPVLSRRETSWLGGGSSKPSPRFDLSMGQGLKPGNVLHRSFPVFGSLAPSFLPSLHLTSEESKFHISSNNSLRCRSKYKPKPQTQIPSLPSSQIASANFSQDQNPPPHGTNAYHAQHTILSEEGSTDFRHAAYLSAQTRLVAVCPFQAAEGFQTAQVMLARRPRLRLRKRHTTRFIHRLPSQLPSAQHSDRRIHRRKPGPYRRRSCPPHMHHQMC